MARCRLVFTFSIISILSDFLMVTWFIVPILFGKHLLIVKMYWLPYESWSQLYFLLCFASCLLGPFFLTILKGGMNDESCDALSMLILCPIVRDLCIVRWVDISLKSDQDSMSIFFKWNIWFIDESSRFVKLTHEKRSRIELVPCLFTFFSDAVPSKSAIMTSWKRC